METSSRTFNDYRVCENACLKRSKPLISDQQPFVVLFSCSKSWCVHAAIEKKGSTLRIVTENPVGFNSYGTWAIRP